MPHADPPDTAPVDTAHLLRELARAATRWSASRDPAGEFAEGRSYGATALERQRLYERWLGRDTWTLADEGLPLLVGLDPRDDWPAALTDPAIASTARALRSVLDAAVAAGTLPAAGTGAGARVEPAQLHRWARSHGHAVPEAFEALMQFIVTAVRPAPPAAAAPAPTASPGARERLLGAAFGLLAADGQAGRDDLGWVQAAAIVERLERESVRWFGQSGLPLPRAEALDALEHWLG